MFQVSFKSIQSQLMVVHAFGTCDNVERLDC